MASLEAYMVWKYLQNTYFKNSHENHAPDTTQSNKQKKGQKRKTLDGNKRVKD